MNIGLLILLFICHWAADFTHLSTPYMLNAKRFGKPIWPIILHAIVHSGLMSSVVIIYLDVTKHFDIDIILLLAGIQLVSHALIDVLKGKMNVWFPAVANPTNKCHWYIFGLDQLLHSLVIVFMWYITLYN